MKLIFTVIVVFDDPSLANFESSKIFNPTSAGLVEETYKMKFLILVTNLKNNNLINKILITLKLTIHK